MSEWIPVAKQTPPLGNRLLVSHVGEVFIAYARRGEWVEPNGYSTHLYPMRPDDAWMPLPLPYRRES